MTKKELKDLTIYCQDYGGVTLTHNGKKTTFKKGFQVAIKRYEKKTTPEALDVQTVNRYLSIARKTGGFVGFWLNNGFLYLDISYHINEKPLALSLGRKENQLTILDWATMDCISC